MKKEEYISRYGIKKYKAYLEKCRIRSKNNYESIKEIMERPVVNDIRFEVTKVADPDIEPEERVCEEDRIAARVQHLLRKWWRKEASKDFILIVTAGNTNKTKWETAFIVELYQLDLQDDEISRFKIGAAQVVKEVFEEFE